MVKDEHYFALKDYLEDERKRSQFWRTAFCLLITIQFLWWVI
jgi:hypothetical protein